MFLGKTTPSYDLETEFNEEFATDHITSEIVEEVRLKFIGEIQQTPPVYSAVKVKGKRAYEYARAGKELELKSRTVKIFEFEVLSLNLPLLEFNIVCSKGTYIRSLARDFGLALNSGAHLTELRRTAIGEHNIDDAVEPGIIKTTNDFYLHSILK